MSWPVMRELWEIVDGILRFAAAVVAGVLPRRYWNVLDVYVPISRAALASALATVALSAALGIPGFYKHAEANAGRAIDLTLQSTGWREAKAGAAPPSSQLAAGAWYASFFSLISFAFFTPLGLFCTYLAASGTVRAVTVVADDPRGDPILSVVDLIGRRGWREVRTCRSRRRRLRLEGAEVPDRLLSGPDAGFPDADLVVVASRRKKDWDAGVFVVTPDKWYRLGTPVDRQMPDGLRTLYPLTALQTQEVLRRAVPYELRSR